MTTAPQTPTPIPVWLKPAGWTDTDRMLQKRGVDRFAVATAALLTVLIHGTLFMWLPWQSNAAGVGNTANVAPQKVEYTLESLTPEELAQMKFMEANPDAPAATPTATNNFSYRDQRVAQPKPEEGSLSDKPLTKGESADLPKIVNGSLREPAPPSPPPSPPAMSQSLTPPTPLAQAAPPASSAPPAAVAGQPGNGEGIRFAEKPADSNEDKPAEHPTAAATPAPQTPPTPTVAAAQPQAPSTQSTKPLARERVQVRVPAGLLVESLHNAGSMGLEAVDAKFSQYGEYLQRLFEAISSAWDLQCDRFNFSTQDLGSRVSVVFVVNPKGEVEGLKVLESTASQSATLLCVNAIQSRAPFGPWTRDMVAQLGEQQAIHITFWYK